MDLVDRLGASDDGAALGQSQHADRLDRAVTAFGSRGRLACEHGEGSVDSIHRIALAEPTSTLPVWSHDLDHPHRTGGEITSHASAERTGALDPDGAYRAKAGEPDQEQVMASGGVWERPRPKRAPNQVDSRCDVPVLVRVDAPNDDCLTASHGASPFD